MGLFSKKDGNKELKGKNIYTDKKNRTIYFSPITKMAYVLKPFHYDTFRRLSTRFVLPIISFLLMSGVVFEKPFLNMPYPILISLAVSALIYIILAYRFYKKFLPTLTKLPSFTPTKKDSMIDSSRKATLSKSALKAGLLIAISVLFILNGQQMYAKNAVEMNLYLNYGLAIGAGVLGLIEVYALITRGKVNH